MSRPRRERFRASIVLRAAIAFIKQIDVHSECPPGACSGWNFRRNCWLWFRKRDHIGRQRRGAFSFCVKDFPCRLPVFKAVVFRFADQVAVGAALGDLRNYNCRSSAKICGFVCVPTLWEIKVLLIGSSLASLDFIGEYTPHFVRRDLLVNNPFLIIII